MTKHADSGLQIPTVSTVAVQGLGVEIGLEDTDDTVLVMARGQRNQECP